MNKSLILEELKRINFITNYEVGDLVSENESKKENIIFEQKINNLFEPKKKVINEQAALQTMMDFTKKSINDAAAQAKWARGTDPIGYWKILFESLTKSGVPVKWQVANDPVKSTYMYWGPWVIYKLGDYNITLSTPKKNILYFKFRNNGGKYVGQQNLKDIQLDSECINLYFLASEVFKKNINQLLSYFYTNWQGHVRDTTGCLGKKTAIDGEMRLLVKTSVTTSWETELGNYIKKYLPADAKFVDGTSGKQITYGTTGLMLNFTKNGWIEFPENGDKNKVPISYGKWYWDEKTKSPIVNASFASFMDVPSLIKDPYTKLIKPDLEKKKKDYEKQNKEIERKADLVYTNLIKAFDYDNDGVDNDYDWTNEELAAKAVEMIDSREVLELVNKKVKARGYYSDIASWFKDEMSSIDPYEYDRVVNKLNSLGYKLDKASWLGYLAAYTVASPLRAVDQTVTAVQDKTNYANKQTAVRQYSRNQTMEILNTQVSPKVDFIAEILLNASRWYGDDEVIIAKLFSRINTKDRYNQIKGIIKKDPFDFVKTFLSTKEIEKPISDKLPSIKASYNDIFADKLTTKNDVNSPEFLKNIEKEMIFTPDNPAGTKKGFVNTNPDTNLMNALDRGQINDKNIKGDTAVVPNDFGWNLNTKAYPIPKPYPMEWINAYKKSIGQLNVESITKKILPKEESIKKILEGYRTKYFKNQIVEGGMDNTIKTKSDIEYDRIQKEKSNVESAKESQFKPIKTMQDWNSELARQKELIPKYCSKPLEYTVYTTCTIPGSVPSKAVRNTFEHTEKLSMYTLCSNYGGLWVKGATTSSLTCTCRDTKSPLFGKVELDHVRNEEAIEKCQNVKGQLYSWTNIGSEIEWKQSSTDWSDPQSWLKFSKEVVSWATIVSAMMFPAAASLITVVGGIATLGVSLVEGDNTSAAIAILFTILPELKFLNLETAVAKSIATKLIKNRVLTAAEIRSMLNIMNQEKQIATAIFNGIGIEAAAIKKLAGTEITAGMGQALKAEIYAARATEQVVKKIAKEGTGVTGISSKKGVEKTTEKTLQTVTKAQQQTSRIES